MGGVTVIVNDLSYELLRYCLNCSETFQIQFEQDALAKIREAGAFLLVECSSLAGVVKMFVSPNVGLNQRIGFTQALTEFRSFGAVVRLSRLCWQLHRVVRVNA